MPGRTFLSVLDLSPEALETCLGLAARLKRERHLGADAPTARALAGHSLALLFDKPSLRTRTGFEIAMRELGGHVTCPPSADALGTREPLADVARTLERWASVAAVRTFEQARLHEFVEATTRLRIVNALTNEEHPCQALADCLTVHERCGAVTGRTLAYVGDGNNVATSLTHAAMMLGLNLRLASPEGFALSDATLAAARQVARHGAEVVQYQDPVEAVRGADAVYADVWTSMGQETDATRRRAAFQGFRVTRALMAKANDDAFFMHCLPAHRGEEVEEEVLEGPRSVVFDQAENRLHTQKALLLMMLEGVGI
ncbi:MAG: ornithine carbamoyltransferase [Acidobacteria bacterium]|jgi:ornithine carbamoyltransferase|nr:ornithine carbamoyltransferase [Acidobacteriota bacterium]MDP7338963.1 ornithine carbamoyltransferase [Vicinamibacterales bacterium]MDP7478810.1 ornithine carbamoyltransferase [Vicinamibacterales bacterium]MDP7691038.1 ornithine carbamoyltransferase [Vicinamibacterales bacterium]HJN46210.1 ornithine carbamoyltransferase [Vicinamibacterales bacterium]|tara:strand:+ start:5285 stop:6226 length:942 start_codon:yes stop_codon:yes gene_type:complete